MSMCVYSLCVVLCVGCGLMKGRIRAQGVLTSEYRAAVKQRTVEPLISIIINSNNAYYAPTIFIFPNGLYATAWLTDYLTMQSKLLSSSYLVSK
jgi:hypothetical protein